MATDKFSVQRVLYKTKPTAWFVMERIGYAGHPNWVRRKAGPFETREAALAARALMEGS